MHKFLVLLGLLAISVVSYAAPNWHVRVYGTQFRNCYAGFDLKHKTQVKAGKQSYIDIRMPNPKQQNAFLVCNSTVMANKNESACSVGRLNVASNECWVYQYDKDHNKCQLSPIKCNI